MPKGGAPAFAAPAGAQGLQPGRLTALVNPQLKQHMD